MKEDSRETKYQKKRKKEKKEERRNRQINKQNNFKKHQLKLKRLITTRLKTTSITQTPPLVFQKAFYVVSVLSFFTLEICFL